MKSIRLSGVPLSSALVLLLLSALPAVAGWQENLEQVLEMDPGPDRDDLVSRIARAGPDWEEVAGQIRDIEFEPAEKGTLLLRSTRCIDGVDRPWVLYVPPAYEPSLGFPLLLRLHGGVNRGDIIDDPVGYAREDQFLSVGETEGWFLLYPFGQEGATWWDRVGMANIRNLIRTVKCDYNIDDDRVWVEGFSDGASAAFAWAMVEPSDFGAFVALNGHMGVGSISGDLPLYAPNLSNTPVYAVTTKGDELYPSHKLRTTIEMAQKAGADIIYRELEGEHDFEYADYEIPRIVDFLKRHRRDPFPGAIVWEAGDTSFGRCHWIRIDRITTDEPAHWHEDFNTALVSERVTIGFVPDYEFEGEGVKVSSVVKETAAEEMGLEKDDVIIRGGSMEIASMDGLVAYKATLKRGDPIEITVRRGQETKILRGTLPKPSNYLIFKREVPSGLVHASLRGNRLVVESSRVGALTFFVHPDIIRLDEDFSIIWNGEEVFEGRIEPDVEFLVRNFLEDRDRQLLYVATVTAEH
jgi:predicted esterase